MKPLRVIIVGATGLVGNTLIKVLEERDFPLTDLRLLATAQSAGKKLRFKGEFIEVLPVSLKLLKGDLIFFSGGDNASYEYGWKAVKQGALVVDNSSTFRLSPEVPLVVPEVNSASLSNHKGLIANPNCTTIQLVIALAPIHFNLGLSRVIVTTFQSVSGSGREAVEELKQQSIAFLNNYELPPHFYPHPIAFNLLPQIGDFDKEGYSQEELKVINETRKILSVANLPITATCVRVPVFQGHSEEVIVETQKDFSLEDVKTLLSNVSGVKLLDNPWKCVYPLPRKVVGTNDVYIGRIRKDNSASRSLHLWVVADNLRVGAATNAIKIAEELIKRGDL